MKKTYCTYSFTLVNKKFVRSFVRSFSQSLCLPGRVSWRCLSVSVSISVSLCRPYVSLLLLAATQNQRTLKNLALFLYKALQKKNPAIVKRYSMICTFDIMN